MRKLIGGAGVVAAVAVALTVLLTSTQNDQERQTGAFPPIPDPREIRPTRLVAQMRPPSTVPKAVQVKAAQPEPNAAPLPPPNPPATGPAPAKRSEPTSSLSAAQPNPAAKHAELAVNAASPEVLATAPAELPATAPAPAKRSESTSSLSTAQPNPAAKRAKLAVNAALAEVLATAPAELLATALATTSEAALAQVPIEKLTKLADSLTIAPAKLSPLRAVKLPERAGAAAAKIIAAASADALSAVAKLVLAQTLAELPVDRLTNLTADLQVSIAPALEPAKLDVRATNFVRALTTPLPRAIPITKADHFVRVGQTISFAPQPEPRVGTIANLLKASDLQLDTPITVIRLTERLTTLDPARLLPISAGGLSQPIKIVENNEVKEIPLAAALERHRLRPTEPIKMLEQMPTYDTTTLAQLQAEGSGNNAIQFKILPSPQALSDRAVEALLGLHKRTDPNSLFYVRTVQRTDVQGIWGIIHSGLIENFAKGMAVQRGEAINTYQVSIPQDADERAPDTSSSFLGRLIHRKAAATSVYNIRERRMARNANLIVPGQQLIIVDFAPAELVAIYRHFVLRGGAQDTASESTQGRTLSEPTARMSY